MTKVSAFDFAGIRGAGGRVSARALLNAHAHPGERGGDQEIADGDKNGQQHVRVTLKNDVPPFALFAAQRQVTNTVMPDELRIDNYRAARA